MRHSKPPVNTTNAEAVRTFICIDLPESLKERIAVLQNELRRIDAQASWVKAENIHLTLKFLGDVPQSKIAGVIAAARHAIGSCSPFQVTVGGAGCFPSPRNPAVLWIGLAKLPETLAKLHRALEDELAKEGVAHETKSFKPHLTIARLRNPRNAGRLADAFLSQGFEDESFLVSEVIVMRSQLSPKGSVYTPQAVIPLKS
jgi:2'-5' RNA ligase